DLLSLKVTVGGTNPANDVSLVRLFADTNCNGVIDPTEAEIVPALVPGANNAVTFRNGANPLLGFSSGSPACAIVACDIPVTATVNDVVSARIVDGFDLTSSVGPYFFPCPAGYPSDSSDVLITAQATPALNLAKSVAPPLIPPQTAYEIGTTVT